MKYRTWKWMTLLSLIAALAIPLGMAAQDGPMPDNKHKHKKYRLIDMGTFGGPSSYIGVNGTGNHLVNNSGVLTGWADTTTPDPNSPNCFDSDCYVGHAFRWKNGVKTDLGVLPGGYSSATGGINDAGWIVGQSQDGSFDPLINFPATRAVLWTSRGITNLGTLGGYESLGVYANNDGQVIGLSTNSIPDPYSLFGWGAQIRAFIWENGAKRDLGTLGGPDAVPGAACSNQRRGLVVGQSYINNIPNQTTGIPTADPFLWKDGRMLDLGTLGGTIGFAQCANNFGQVTGASNLAGDLVSHPFIWDRGVLRDLGTLGGDNGTANWINDDGVIVGKADLPGSQVHDAFIWKKGRMKDLGNLPGYTCSNAHAINSRGQGVGCSSDCAECSRAFVWENNGPIVDLNDLIPRNSALQLVDAEDINERGEIAGVGTLANGDLHAYLLIPDGDCDDDNEARIAETQNSVAPERTAVTRHPASDQQSGAPPTPIERSRNLMRQRYHLPGQPAAARD